MIIGIDRYENGVCAFSRWPDAIYHYSPVTKNEPGVHKLIAVFRLKKK